ncbi:MAG: hypothetical protein GX657_12300 [Chloroflexi bacterium]|nr:hypothetical protein [Chloroflexota bacterium]
MALYLRLRALDATPITPSLARTLAAAASLARSGVLPSSGAGAGHSAFLSYLFAVPALLSRDARWPLVLLAVLQAAGLVAFVALVSRRYGRWAAGMAGLWWAANPWAVLQVQGAGVAALLPVLTVVSLGGLLRAVVDRNPWGWTLAAAALGAGAALSPWGLALGAALPLAVVAYHRRVSWPHLLLGLGIGLLMAGPSLYGANLTRLATVRAAFGEARAVGTLLRRAGDALLALRRAHSGLGAQGLAAPALPAALGWPRAGLLDEGAGWLAVAGWLCLGPLALTAWGHWKARQDPAVFLLPALTAWGPLALLVLARVAPNAEGLAALQPLGFLGGSLLITRLPGALARRGTGGRRLALAAAGTLGVLAAALIGWQGATSIHLQESPAGWDSVPEERAGVPLRFWHNTANVLLRQAQAAGTAQVWQLVDEETPLRLDGAVLPYLLGGQVRLVPLGPHAMYLPAGRPGVYLRLAEGSEADAPLPAASGEDKGLVLAPDGAAHATVTVATARPVDAVLDEIGTATDVRFQVGLSLLGYDWPAEALPGGTARLCTYWTFADVPEGERDVAHRLTVRLLAADGRTVAEAAGLGLREADWAVGYLLAQWHDLDIPADLAEGELALGVEVVRLDAQGRPLPPQVDLPGETSAVLGQVPIALGAPR